MHAAVAESCGGSVAATLPSFFHSRSSTEYCYITPASWNQAFPLISIHRTAQNATMTTSEKYKHQSLGQGKHIRVLILHPSRDFQAPVTCSLREISLEAKADKACFYDALSYVWGSPTGDREIICDGQTLMVTDNCLTALRYLRPKKKARTLWVDAICIDQSSINERNHQVKLMGDVYKLARRVLIWLGEGDADSPGLMRRMRWLGPCMPYKSIVPFLSTVRRRSGI